MASFSVFIVESVSPSLRGELTRWMIEPKAGVFIGKLSGMVRNKLWGKIIKNIKKGGCTMAYSYNNEQGYKIESYGDTTRTIVDFEGLSLVMTKEKP
ncbi:type I-E CRISPR-associated endoribonuclease Cas2e [Methanocella arvoryzae]|uniref:Predicted CRISPR-associated protein n=1 Tax=Methanocella arvoryzae (strain DSM 22066 / NBRC 105507 / MRE50) TaxID=351160 RepID=Q0W581_METAR|nr:type I-E CRISPR-associated endoribonuclease Cas2e [Methanocella arvoryzae]CAJ36462.1 predicted CRISPR-associated protein [Methanocella arvoryzae MRE50]